MSNKNKNIPENVNQNNEGTNEKPEEATEKKVSAFEKGKELGKKYKKKILYGVGTVVTGAAGFVGGVLFERHRSGEDEDPMEGVEQYIDRTPDVPEAEAE